MGPKEHSVGQTHAVIFNIILCSSEQNHNYIKKAL